MRISINYYCLLALLAVKGNDLKYNGQSVRYNYYCIGLI